MSEPPIRIIVEAIQIDWHPPLTFGAGDPGSFTPGQITAVVRAIAPTVETRTTVELTGAEQQEVRALVERIAARVLANRELELEGGP